MPKGIYGRMYGKGGYREGAGRKSLPIDWEMVNKFFMAGSTCAEVAAMFGLNEKYFSQRIKKDFNITASEYRYYLYLKGNSMLHGKQFELAVKGDRSMLVWLGKNRLKQSDKIEQKVDSSIEVSQKAILELPDNGRRKLELSNDHQTEIESSTRTTD